MDLSSTEALDLWSAFARQRRVIYALMLRNIRTRFFGNGLGYVVGIAWPLSHILILVIAYDLMGRGAPYGESIALFIGTGVVPFQIFSYMSRFMMLSVIRNRPLLLFPEVKTLDILLAGALLEMLTAACIIIVLGVLAWWAGINAVPNDLVQASYVFGVTVLLGLGFGLLNGVIVLAVPSWFTGYSLFIVIMWVSAGILFVPDYLPVTFREILSYHPVLQVIEWTRATYYEGYGGLVLDRAYVIKVALVSLFLGLIIERAARGHILAAR